MEMQFDLTGIGAGHQDSDFRQCSARAILRIRMFEGDPRTRVLVIWEPNETGGRTNVLLGVRMVTQWFQLSEDQRDWATDASSLVGDIADIEVMYQDRAEEIEGKDTVILRFTIYDKKTKEQKVYYNRCCISLSESKSVASVTIDGTIERHKSDWFGSSHKVPKVRKNSFNRQGRGRGW